MDRGAQPTTDAYGVARLELARLAVFEDTSLADIFRRVTEIAARAMNVERVGLWIFERGARELRCVEQFQLSTGEHSCGELLDARRFPTYVQALEEHREIVADDVRTHPLTRELAEQYLAPHGITSMLDAPVFRHGDVVGVLCHEHVGSPRQWAPADAAFAAIGADIAASVFEQAARLEAERRLRTHDVEVERARKLEALGMFAAQIAHDFNNVLTVVQSESDLLAMRQPAEPLRIISEAAQRGSKLVKQLLAFARPADTVPPTVTFTDSVEQILPILRSAIAGPVTLRAEVQPGAWRVRIDPTDIERVLMNLAVNARDAMPEGGEIVLSLATHEAPGGARQIVLEVRDTGAGMDPDTKARIFEPFFTTKGPDRGSGLGLATVHGIVRRAGGSVAVESAVGHGTTVRVRLPIVD